MEWQKSSFSNGSSACVEVGSTLLGKIGIRENEQPDEVIFTNPKNFAAFIEGVKAGEFDKYAEIE